MGLANIRRFRTHILDSITIPMMSSSRNQIARVLVATNPWLWRQIRMVAKIEPNIRVPVNEREIRRLKIPTTVLVVVIQLRASGNTVVLSCWEGPCAPLLRVRDLQDARDERGTSLASGLVATGFGTG
jgi:hypothetical protein